MKKLGKAAGGVTVVGVHQGAARPPRPAPAFVALVLGLALSGLLAACSEQPQTATTRKADDKPWSGASTAFTATGWKAGDAAGWEQQIRARTQAQNEYVRAPAKP